MSMSDDSFTNAAIELTAKNLSVADLIKAADTLRAAGNGASVERLHAAWIEHHPEDPLLYAVLFNYAVALSDSNKLAQATSAFERCLAVNPSFIPAYINLGRTYERTGKVGMAILQWSAAMDKTSGVTGTTVSYKTTALNQSARALEDAQQDEAAEKLLHQSLELDSRQREVIQHYVALRQRQCKWPVIQAAERITASELTLAMSPLSAAAFTDDPILQMAVAGAYNKHDVGIPTGIRASWPQAERGGPLRIGYLSSDLREHAVGYLMTEVFALHDRAKVETFAYYCGPDSNDQLHNHFKRTADHFISVGGMSDAVAAQRMSDDGIQVLVDLNGYTRDARLKLVALRPAPIIVNWLGFPGTMASPYHDYIIADDWIIPPSHEMYYTEKVLRLPCYQPNLRDRAVSEKVPTRAEAGLPEGAMVYCCFNGLHKLNRVTYDHWLAILEQVPGSVLWMLDGGASTSRRLKDYAVARGVNADRIVFAPKLANPSHLARYPLADLFLDTMPYGAHTTASDALWMGVPVLTLSGNSFASRVCGSLARSAGMSDSVCASAMEYVQKAVSLGRDASSRAEMRQRLRAAKKDCVLFDMPGLVRHLEDLYEQMWRQRGHLPRPDLSNLDTYLEVASHRDHETSDRPTQAELHELWRERLHRLAQRRSIDVRRACAPFEAAPT
jgi:predicted O-linked N-acetylglucosamine transferase (SPINDLY family)